MTVFYHVTLRCNFCAKEQESRQAAHRKHPQLPPGWKGYEYVPGVLVAPGEPVWKRPRFSHLCSEECATAYEAKFKGEQDAKWSAPNDDEAPREECP